MRFCRLKVQNLVLKVDLVNSMTLFYSSEHSVE